MILPYAMLVCSNGNRYVASSGRHLKWLKWYFGYIYGVDRIERIR